jgi:hypothetical protein
MNAVLPCGDPSTTTFMPPNRKWLRYGPLKSVPPFTRSASSAHMP